MATLQELEARNELFKLDPALEPQEQEWRCLWASQKLRDWILQTLPKIANEWDEALSTTEQFDVLMEIYASGETLTVGWSFKCLDHLGDGVWELKTADLRIFGWFCTKDCFVGVVADSAYRVKQHDLVRGYAGEVVRFRNALDLSIPKFVAGEDPNDVVSNYDTPS